MQPTSYIEEKFPYIPLLLICLLALWLRLPGISAGMPYFYAEDEAHHFNRTVEMVKEGRYDPQYFHKPSLHFYLRMPVVALSYLWSVKQGYLNSVKEIETRNSFGLAGYAFTASHAGIVKWNRAFSVALSLLLVAFTFLLCREVTGTTQAGLAAALLVAISPELLINSPIIGVDMLMALMCVVSSYAALRVFQKYSTFGLWIVGILCGLAFSSKYNALPICALPLAVCFGLRKFSARDITAAILGPAAGFFLGSPFILVSIPLFLDHLAYEIWHYGVAGHEGHMAQPGIDQALFYAKWLVKDGVGWTACFLALAGFGLLESKRKKEMALFLVFPALFAALMIGQKANFTRNMVSIIPYIAILAAIGLELVLRTLKIRESARPAVFWLCIPVLCLQPLIGSLSFIRTLRSKQESRITASEWIANEGGARDIAISGELQFPTSIYRLPGNSRVDTSKSSAMSLYQGGFDILIAGPEYQPSHDETTLLTAQKEFSGIDSTQRIIENPRITVFDLRADKADETLRELHQKGKLTEKLVIAIGNENDPTDFFCSDATGKNLESPGEDYCWLQSRFTSIFFKQKAATAKSAQGTLALTLMTPWPNQTLELKAQSWSYTVDLSQAKPGEWITVNVPIASNVLQDTQGVLFRISQVHSPISRKLSPDIRRLGIAIKSARFSVP